MTGNPATRRLVSQGRPDPRSLCALGPVLCLHAASDPHPLAGWSKAHWAAGCVRLEADGPRESVCFYTAGGETCWQLHVLPDSDFLAWARLIEGLPSFDGGDVASTHWLERCRRVVRPAWRACALRLHVVPGCTGDMALAAAEVQLSPLGADRARRIHQDLHSAVAPAAG